MCHFLPVHHFEWYFWPGRRSKYNRLVYGTLSNNISWWSTHSNSTFWRCTRSNGTFSWYTRSNSTLILIFSSNYCRRLVCGTSIKQHIFGDELTLTTHFADVFVRAAYLFLYLRQTMGEDLVCGILSNTLLTAHFRGTLVQAEHLFRQTIVMHSV